LAIRAQIKAEAWLSEWNTAGTELPRSRTLPARVPGAIFQVLDRLSGGQQASVKRRLALVFVHDFGAFIEDTLDCKARGPRRSIRFAKRRVI
jgi:hypothetical protein